MKDKVLVTLLDEQNLDYSKQLFASAKFNGGWDGDFLILSIDIDPEKLEWFKKQNIYILPCKKISSNNKNVNEKLLAKLNLFSPELKQWKKILYLDVDIIIRAKLDQILPEEGIKAAKYYKGFNKYKIFNHTYSYKNLYSNSTLALDSDLIENDTLSNLELEVKKFTQNTKKPSHLKLAEELITNHYFQKQFKPISIIYNVVPHLMKSIYGLDNKEVQGAIIHFQHEKPWDQNSYFHNEWLLNYQKANDFNNSPSTKKSYSPDEIEAIENNLAKKWILNYPKNKFTNIKGKLGNLLVKK